MDDENMSNGYRSSSFSENITTAEASIQSQNSYKGLTTETCISFRDILKPLETTGLTSVDLNGTSQQGDVGSKTLGRLLAEYSNPHNDGKAVQRPHASNNQYYHKRTNTNSFKPQYLHTNRGDEKPTGKDKTATSLRSNLPVSIFNVSRRSKSTRAVIFIYGVGCHRPELRHR